MKRKGPQPLEIIHRECAGIDIGGSSHYVAVDSNRFEPSVRCFGCYTDELEEMGRWLQQCQVKVVAMESTGVYWIPVYEVLERMGFEVHLVNPRATKHVSGRKSDVLDCQWLWQLMSFGLLDSAFRPPDRFCELRAYVRQRASLVRDRAREVQHMQKALTQMNLQLDNTISNIVGKTGQLIIRAIVAGERDPNALASLRDGRIHADEETIARSLYGTWRDEHLFALQLALERYDFLTEHIERCQQRILALCGTLSLNVVSLVKSPRARKRAWEKSMSAALHQMLGVDLTEIPTIALETALVVATEVGRDLSAFPSVGHFCSWLGLAPHTRISGGRALPGRPQPRLNRLGQALKMAASTARHSQSFIGAQHRARLARLDKPRAIKATAHQLARLIYAMLTRGEAYVEKGIAQFEAVRRDKSIHALRRRAQQLGFEVVENPI